MTLELIDDALFQIKEANVQPREHYLLTLASDSPPVLAALPAHSPIPMESPQ
jgi:hypothetical protein